MYYVIICSIHPFKVTQLNDHCSNQLVYKLLDGDPLSAVKVFQYKYTYVWKVKLLVSQYSG